MTPGRQIAKNRRSLGCVCQLGLLFVGLLVLRALLFGVYIRVPDFWQIPAYSKGSQTFRRSNPSAEETTLQARGAKGATRRVRPSM